MPGLPAEIKHYLKLPMIPILCPIALSTDMQDSNIVFGGEQKLRQAIREAYKLFKPKAIGVFATCPVGLIGDDIHAVAREMKEELGINIFGFSCEGYKGVSQSAGHHIANNGLFKHVVGLEDKGPEGKFKVNLLGEYNIGGDAFELERIFKKAGITLVATFSGNSTLHQFETAHTADLNMIMCHRSINYLAEMMETKFGIPWIKVNFIGANATAKSLRKIADYFGDAELIESVEEIIAEEMAAVNDALAKIKPEPTEKWPCYLLAVPEPTIIRNYLRNWACLPYQQVMNSVTATIMKEEGCCQPSRLMQTAVILKNCI